jgi:hypothetical protein
MNTSDPLPQPTPVTAGAIPWYHSPVYVLAASVVLGALCNLFPRVRRLMQQAGFTGATDVLEFIAAVGTLIGGLAIAVVRWWAKVQPLVWTQGQAASHPATIAVVRVQQEMAAANIPTARTLQAAIESAPKVQPQQESKT